MPPKSGNKLSGPEVSVTTDLIRMFDSQSNILLVVGNLICSQNQHTVREPQNLRYGLKKSLSRPVLQMTGMSYKLLGFEPNSFWVIGFLRTKEQKALHVSLYLMHGYVCIFCKSLLDYLNLFYFLIPIPYLLFVIILVPTLLNVLFFIFL